MRATDAAGNREATPAIHTWAIDTTPPGTILTDKPAATTQGTSATFGFASAEADVTFECSLDGAAFAGCSSPKEYTGLSVGQHTFRVRATDAAGNVEPEPDSHTRTVQAPDTTPPVTSINVIPEALTQEPDASFEFISNEQGSTFECSLDGVAFAPCASPKAYSNLSIGSHQFQVRATDPAENVDATPATHAWTITSACNGSTVTVGAAADGWVLQSSASQNYGTDSVLKVETKTGADARAYVRFNLPAIPAGCQVTGAKLRLYASSYKTGRTLQAFRVAAAWTEGGLTWTDQPATAGTAVTTPSGFGYREWLVTQLVRDMYAPSANHGVTIRDASPNGQLPQDLHSREKGTDSPPRLVITFGA